MAPQPAGTHFQLPGYLLSDEERRSYYDTEHAGTGLVWAGLVLITIPAITANLSPISLGAWGMGLAIVLVGMVRARIDRQALLRSGAAAGLASIVILAVVVNQIIRTETPQAADTEAPAEVAEASGEDSRDDLADPAAGQALDGQVPVLRGTALHSGVYPGPGPEGDPYRLWKYDTGTQLKSTPVIANQSAYFGTHNGYLVALDLVTGLPRWKLDLGGYPVAAAPALSERSVFVASGYKVFSVDEAKGTLNWTFDMTYAGESAPVYADGVVYVASKESQLHAIDAITGELIRTFKTDDQLLFGSPAISDGAIVIGGDDGAIAAWDRESGRLAWHVEVDGGVYSSPAIHNNSVFVTVSSRTVLELDLETGEVVWDHPVGGDASPAYDGETLVIASDDGGIYALAPNTPSPEQWVYPTSSADMQSPAIVDDVVYAVTGSTIHALDLSDGKAIWTYPIGSNATTEAVVVDGMIYVGAEDGNLYAIAGSGPADDEADASRSTG